MKKLKLLSLVALLGCVGCNSAKEVEQEEQKLVTFTEILTVEDNCIFNLYYNILQNSCVYKPFYLSEKAEEEYRYDKLVYTYTEEMEYLDIVAYPCNRDIVEHLIFCGHNFSVMISYYIN